LSVYPKLLLGFRGRSYVRIPLAEIPDDGVQHLSGLLITYLLTFITRFLGELWLGNMDNFKQAILDRLSRPTPLKQSILKTLVI
jgi:hypothetical protein